MGIYGAHIYIYIYHIVKKSLYVCIEILYAIWIHRVQDSRITSPMLENHMEKKWNRKWTLGGCRGLQG